jgi:2-(1,2-epoxy-1,2-dihydrophenyl)acetyl-CoA isomerase
VTSGGASGVEGLVVGLDGGVLSLVLDRPSAGNAFTVAIQRALVDRLARASADPAVRVVVLGATGDRHFCTGPDLRDPEMRPDPDRAPGNAARRLRTGSQAVVAALLDCEKPVLCSLNGTAAGGGANVVLACDLVVAADTARLIPLFVRRGLAPDGGAAYLLAQRLPPAVAKQLLFLGDDLSMPEAHQLGLVNAVVPAAELAAETERWALRLAAAPTLALAAAKAMVHQALDSDRATAFATEALLVEQVAGSADVAEGIDAYLTARTPTFRGR